MKYFKKLVGDNIYLSPMNLEDAEKFTEWLNDFNITDYTEKSSILISLQSEKEWLENNVSKEGMFSIIRLEDDALVGTCCLNEIDHIKRTATLGIFIGDNDSRNKGYGTESIRLILDFGFNYLNLNNIMLRVMSFNERAIACYKKCGFKEFGKRRQCNFVNGKYHDTMYMEILAEEFNDDYIRNKNIK